MTYGCGNDECKACAPDPADLAIQNHSDDRFEYQYDHSPTGQGGFTFGDAQLCDDWSYRIAWRRIGDEDAEWNVIERFVSACSDTDPFYDEDAQPVLIMQCDETYLVSGCDDPMWPDDRCDEDMQYSIIDNLDFWYRGDIAKQNEEMRACVEREVRALHRADIAAIKAGWWS